MRLSLICTGISFALSMLPLYGQQQKVSRECLIRNSSLTISECEERLKPNAPVLVECASLQGEEYRVCAVHLPSDDLIKEQKEYERQNAQNKIQNAQNRESLEERLKPYGFILLANINRLATPDEAEQALIKSIIASKKQVQSSEFEVVRNQARNEEVRAYRLGFEAIIAPQELSIIRSDEPRLSGKNYALIPQPI